MSRNFSCLLLTMLMSFTIPAYAGQGEVARAIFSNDVVDREPVDELGSVVKAEYSGIQKVYFFTDLRGMQGSAVIHRWLLDGAVMAEIPFDIGGDRWRVWSSKRLMPGFEGTWTAQVVKNGKVIASRSFRYVDDDAPAANKPSVEGSMAKTKPTK